MEALKSIGIEARNAPDEWAGPNGALPSKLKGYGNIGLMRDAFYSIYARDPASYAAAFGSKLPGMPDAASGGAATAEPPSGFASEAERQAWLNANATPKNGDYVTEWKRRKSSLSTLLSGAGGDIGKLGEGG